MAFKKRNRGAIGYDAATAGSMAFLRSELELVTPKLIKPLTSSTHPRDVPITVGGGFIEFESAWATNYGSTGGNEYGLQGTNNTDIPQVQVDLNKGVWKQFIFSAGFIISEFDLRKLEVAKRNGQPAPVSLDKLLREGVQLVYNKALEKVVYLGWLGYPGIFNNTNVTHTAAAAPWVATDPTQILDDINGGLLTTLEASSYSLDGMADSVLLPWSRYSVLMQPMYGGSGGGAFRSILDYILDSNIGKQNGIDLKIFPVANDWAATQGAGGSTRAAFYRNNDDTLEMRIGNPLEIMLTVPTNEKGPAYSTSYGASIGQVKFFREQAMTYLDTI